MICQNNLDVVIKIAEMYLEFLENAEYGEFSVALTVDKGLPVKVVKSERENIVRYKKERVILEKQEG